jgi:Transposase DDE domain
MLTIELPFACVYCLIDDAITAGVLSIPRRPGPAPACTDAELLTIAVARHLPGRRSEKASWPRSAATGRACSRTCRTSPRSTAAPAGCGVPSNSSAPPAPPPSQPIRSSRSTPPRSRSSTPPGSAVQTAGPARGNDLTARSGRDGAHAEWSSGFRLAIRTDLGRRIVRAWSLVPAAVDERQTGADLFTGDAASIDALLLDKGFTSRRFTGEMASAGIEVIIPPTRAQRQTMPRTLQRLIARLRNRVETSFKEITDHMELARHGAHTLEGLLTRTVATLAAHTLLLTQLAPHEQERQLT